VSEIASIPVWESVKQKKLDDLFKIEEASTEVSSTTLNSDASEVRRIFQKMKRGETVINARAGKFRVLLSGS